jgi:hypothetical protein
VDIPGGNSDRALHFLYRFFRLQAGNASLWAAGLKR